MSESVHAPRTALNGQGSFRNTGPAEGSSPRSRRILEEGEPVAVGVADYEPARSSSAGLLGECDSGFVEPPLMGVEVVQGKGHKRASGSLPILRHVDRTGRS